MTSSELTPRLYNLVSVASAQEAVKTAVEANHDNNQWWPLHVDDWRVRMLVAGWSTRVSYAMVDIYAEVVKKADAYGWDALTSFNDQEIIELVRPVGLADARLRYLRSLESFVTASAARGRLPLTMPVDDFIEAFAAEVSGASYKVAQCAALYARGYHCGVMPVDSGMLSRLAPLLGMDVGRRPLAHERMRQALESCAAADSSRYHALITERGHRVTIPAQAAPTWWLHLVLIYFKRLFLNPPASPKLCGQQPVCPALLNCDHSGGG
ncbi:hypothetical protein SAMN05421505_12913 [Sinosporangium album]|uniref:Uncharacterized protein n=1 Tax=Sinosporangium album TaxID=504805 RepID=A0A1G8GTU7_9ACTN|nr:hypothetical protein [Sinosporangium album]SDH97769.1 hypothetical protein SAMN05421505_12913 [Sinosporangium album]